MSTGERHEGTGTAAVAIQAPTARSSPALERHAAHVSAWRPTERFARVERPVRPPAQYFGLRTRHGVTFSVLLVDPDLREI
jgi:hypothetical protein